MQLTRRPVPGEQFESCEQPTVVVLLDETGEVVLCARHDVQMTVEAPNYTSS